MTHNRRERLVAHVHGQVQGVGFRLFVLQWARSLGVAGTVRNCEDGRVRVEAEGPRNLLDDLLALLRTGPPAARVTRVTESWEEPEGLTRFTVEPS
ncbi:MAG TPA: acylphosphatase [Candidatus Polarisedimenticolia bacterium]|nr:acylphosphatase [Candidatus Polarisedimenticolia bacterium]